MYQSFIPGSQTSAKLLEVFTLTMYMMPKKFSSCVLENCNQDIYFLINLHSTKLSMNQVSIRCL